METGEGSDLFRRHHLSGMVLRDELLRRGWIHQTVSYTHLDVYKRQIIEFPGDVSQGACASSAHAQRPSSAAHRAHAHYGAPEKMCIRDRRIPMHTHTPFTNLAFCIRTFGCQMNKHDSERVAGMLEGLGCLLYTSRCV